MTDRVTWYWRRFRAMSIREAAARGRRSVRHRVDATTYHVGKRVWRRRWEPSSASLLSGPAVEEPLGFLVAERAAAIRSSMPEEVERVRARADKVLSGRVELFGYPGVLVPPDAVDPVPTPGPAWPDRHAKRLDYRSAGTSDPKWTWEVNRCQELPLLVSAWLLTEDEGYARAAARRLIQWVETHPPGRGIAWSNGFEAGLRAISLSLTLDALRGSGLLREANEQRLLRALWQHALWIERDPSLGSSANNHRVGELVGLVAIGSLAPELRDSQRWVETSLAELEREAGRQILGDGTSAEQAFAYHVFVIDLLLLAVAVLEATGRAAPPGIAAALARSGDALWAQLDVDEPAPTYGDTDDGRAVVLDANDLRDPRGAAAGIAATLGHAPAARVAGAIDAHAWWLFGAAGAARLVDRDFDAPGSVTLRDGGYTVFRGVGRRAIVDHGPLGLGSLAAHGHADALGVQVSLGPHQVVADPGVGSYFAHPEVRRAFRSTGFHATVLVDDLDSSEQSGPFLWTHHAQSRVLRFDLDAGIVVAEHTGYRRLADPVVHRRLVSAPSDSPHLLVVDRLDARGLHRYSQRWPLHPELDLVESGLGRIVAVGASYGVVIVPAAVSGSPGILSYRGAHDPLAGWWSPRLETYVPSWLLGVNLEVTGPVELATAVVPFAGDVVPHVAIDLEVSGSRNRVTLSVAASTHVLEFDLEANEPLVVSHAPMGVV